MTPGTLGPGQARDAVAAVAAACSGHVGLAARHLGTGEELSRNPGEVIQTASTVKVAIHAEVLRRARLGLLDLGTMVTTRPADLTGGSGMLGVLRPGVACTVSDLCTLMIAVSDNTATNMLIGLLGGAADVSSGVASLGYPDIVLNRKVSAPPPPLVIPSSPDQPPPAGPLATATPAALCRLLAALHAGTVVDAAASSQMIATLRCQQDRSLFPRAYLALAEPGEPPGPGAPALAHKTGCISGCRADTGLLYLPRDGGVVAYCAVADRLADQSMTALAEGEEVLGRLGAIVLARWWPGPGPVPLRPGWLPAAPGACLPAARRPPPGAGPPAARRPPPGACLPAGTPPPRGPAPGRRPAPVPVRGERSVMPADSAAPVPAPARPQQEPPQCPARPQSPAPPLARPRSLARPPALRPGDRVAVLSASGPADPAALRAGLDALRFAGLEPVVYPSAGDGGSMRHYLAGDDRLRAGDLRAALTDPGIAGILFATGGYGAQRTLAALDWDGLAGLPPKILAGYSDVTAILEAAAARLGWASLHSPMVAAPGAAAHYSFGSLLRALMRPEQATEIHYPDAVTLASGTARGITLGGNVTLLTSSLGTGTSLPARGAILLLEDVDEEDYRIDRMLTQLRRCGYLDGVAGIIGGTFTRCGEPAQIEAILGERLGDLGVPLIAWADVGHGDRFQTFPVGVAAELDAAARTLRLLDPPLVPAPGSRGSGPARPPAV